MKLTIEGNADEIKSVLKNPSATVNSQEIQEAFYKEMNSIINKTFKELFVNQKLL